MAVCCPFFGITISCFMFLLVLILFWINSLVYPLCKNEKIQCIYQKMALRWSLCFELRQQRKTQFRFQWWQHLVGSSPIIRTRKSRGSFEPRLFSYDDVELKPPQKRGPQKIQKIFWGRGAAMERLRCFIEDKIPISGICRDESPIIRTRMR